LRPHFPDEVGLQLLLGVVSALEIGDIAAASRVRDGGRNGSGQLRRQLFALADDPANFPRSLV
jgi:hypothetical protein